LFLLFFVCRGMHPPVLGGVISSGGWVLRAVLSLARYVHIPLGGGGSDGISIRGKCLLTRDQVVSARSILSIVLHRTHPGGVVAARWRRTPGGGLRRAAVLRRHTCVPVRAVLRWRWWCTCRISGRQGATLPSGNSSARRLHHSYERGVFRVRVRWSGLVLAGGVLQSLRAGAARFECSCGVRGVLTVCLCLQPWA